MHLHPLTNATTEGPFGLPMLDRQALAIEAIVKALPKEAIFQHKRLVTGKSVSEVLSGERADVSWISTEHPDRMSEVVIARGLNDSQFKLNPIVTLQHNYNSPPVGKSLWRKVVSDGTGQGVKAKTIYPTKPESWTESAWPPDVALSLIQADLLRGKSIGFLPTKVHAPKTDERKAHDGWDTVDLVIDEWILLEYACTFLPAQQNAIVEQVSKSGFDLPLEFAKILAPDWNALCDLTRTPELKTTPKPDFTIAGFTPLEEIEKALMRHISSIDLSQLATKAAEEALAQHCGRV